MNFFLICNFYFFFLRIVLQFFKLKYILNQIFRKHTYLASIYSRYLITEFKIGELSEEHQKYNRNTPHKHTLKHHMHAHTQSRKNSHLHKMFKKAHMSHKYLLAFNGVLIFCWVINTIHNVIAKHLDIFCNWDDKTT